VIMVLNRPEDEPIAPSGRIGQVIGGAAIVYLIGRLALMLAHVKPPAAALAAPAPARDLQEPNEDVTLVRPGGAFSAGTPVLPARTTLEARLDAADDPRDVYRIAVPARRRLRVTVRAGDGLPVAVSVWGPRTVSVLEGGSARKRDLLAQGTVAVTAAAQKKAFTGYVALAAGARRRTSYTLTVTTVAGR